MAEWFDFATLGRLVEAMPNISFVLIGPDGLARERLMPRSNLHILGPKSFVDLPAYLHNVDVGLIPFDVQAYPALVHAVHPLKLYEYLACGLPVVATRWQELERLASPAILCDSDTDFETAMRKALADPPDPRIGRDYARAADWRGRVELILAALSTRGRKDAHG